MGRRAFSSLGAAWIPTTVTGQVTSSAPQSCGSWSGESWGHQAGEGTLGAAPWLVERCYQSNPLAFCRGRCSTSLDHRRVSWVTPVERSQAPTGSYVMGRDTTALPISAPTGRGVPGRSQELKHNHQKKPPPLQITGQASNKALSAQCCEKRSSPSPRRFLKFIQHPPYLDAEGLPRVRALPWVRPRRGAGKGQAK